MPCLRQFTIGQGPGWWDLETYRAAGIPTRVVQAWRDGEFAKQMETGVIDLFPMGLDKFKPVNDMFGHAAGDEVLRTVAKRLLAWVDEDMYQDKPIKKH